MAAKLYESLALTFGHIAISLQLLIPFHMLPIAFLPSPFSHSHAPTGSSTNYTIKLKTKKMNKKEKVEFKESRK